MESCWLYTGPVNNQGYGYVNRGGRIEGVHRIMLALVGRPAGPRQVVDHACRVKRCANPAHLEPVTQAENVRRGRGAFCVRGHELVAVPATWKRQVRFCPVCAKIRRSW